MKIIAMLAFIGLVAGARFPMKSFTKEPTELLYKYETQFSTGVEESSDVYNIIRLSSKVIMTTDGSFDPITGAKIWKIQFKEVNMRQRNNETDRHPSQMLPMSDFNDLELSDLWFSVEKYLKKPFIAHLNPGKQMVMKLEFSESDRFWSINIKKSFLSAIQVNFRKEAMSESRDSRRWNKEVDENTVAGDCTTTYNVDKIDMTETESNANLYRVDKTIDFNNCLNPVDRTRSLPGFWSGLHHTSSWSESRLKNLLDVSHLARYVVQNKERNGDAVVETMSAKTVYTTSPFKSSTHGSIRSYAIQTLRLLNNETTEEVRDTVNIEESMREHHEGLRLLYPEESTITTKFQVRDHVVVILKRMMVRTTNVSDHQNVIRIIRHYLDTTDDMEKIAEKLVTLKSEFGEERTREILARFILDICPQVASHNSVVFLVKVARQLLKEETLTTYVEMARLSIWDLPTIFIKCSAMGKVQLKTLKLLYKMVSSDTFKNKLYTAERMNIFSSCWLSVGAMMNVYYSKQRGVDPFVVTMEKDSEYINKLRFRPWELRKQFAMDAEQLRSEFVDKMRNWLRNKGDRVVLALKVIKNSGLYEFTEDLKNIMFDRSAPMVNRVHAIIATEKILKKSTLMVMSSEEVGTVVNEYKYLRSKSNMEKQLNEIRDKIHAHLLRIFRNVREDPELRIAAYRMLVQSPIKRSVLNSMIMYVMSEPTQHVYTYVIRHMIEMVESNIPRYEKTARVIRPVLSMIKRRQPEMMTYSRSWSYNMWSKLHEMGLSVETNLIMSDKSFTPRWTHIRLDHETYGRQIPLFEISVRAEGLQKLLEKWLGPNGLIYTYSKHMAKSGGRFPTMDSNTLLDILPRILKEVPEMDLTLSLFDYQIVHIQTTGRDINKIKTATTKNVIDIIRNMHNRNVFAPNYFSIHNHYEMPTTIGSFLEWDQLISLKKSASHLEIRPVSLEKNTGEIAFSASLPVTLSISDRFGCNLNQMQHYTILETVMRVNRGQQINMKVKYDISEKSRPQIQILTLTPNTTEPIFQFRSQLRSIVSEFNVVSSRLVSNHIVNYMNHRQSPKPTHEVIEPLLNNFLQHLGFTLKIRRSYYPNKMIFNSPCISLMGNHNFDVQIQPIKESYSRRQYIDLKIRLETENTKTVEMKMELKSTSDVRELTEGSLIQKLVHFFVNFKKESTDRKYTVNGEFKWFVGLPSSYSSVGYPLTFDAVMELPQDLHMLPRSLPLNPHEWIQVGRQLNVIMNIHDKVEGQKIVEFIYKSKVNKELIRLLKEQYLNERDFINAFPLLKKCLNESRRSNTEEPLNANPLFTPSCVSQYKQLNALTETKIKMQRYADWFLFPAEESFTQQVFLWIKNMVYQYKTEEKVRMDTSKEWMEMTIKVSPFSRRVLNITLECPMIMLRAEKVQLPFPVFVWTGVSRYGMEWVEHLQGGSSKCQLLHSHVRTFDDVTYTIPQSLLKKMSKKNCPVLLAKDCSNKQKFEILKKIDREENKKSIIVRVNTDTQPMEIKITKKLESTDQESEVTINKRVFVVPSELEGKKENVKLFERKIQTSSGPVTVKIYRFYYSNTFLYRVVCPEHQLEVLAGGDKLRSVQIRVSPFYRNKMCGLCGDYNSEKFEEFKAPNYHRVLPHSQQMVQEYILGNTEQCQAIKNNEELVPEMKHLQSEYTPRWFFWRSQRANKCKVSNDDKRIKTFKHANMEIMSKDVLKMLTNTECRVKLTAVKINNQVIRVYKKQHMIIVKSEGDDTMELKLSTSPPSVVVSDSAPRGMNIQHKTLRDNSMLCIIKSTENPEEHLTIRIKPTGRVSIKASNIKEDEFALCEVSHPSHLVLNSQNLYTFLRQFTDNSVQCSEQMKRNVHNCRVSESTVKPFYKHKNRFTSREHTFLNENTLNKLADTNAPILLSVDKIDESDDMFSVHLKHSKQYDQVERKIVLKKNKETILKVTVPKTGALSLEYLNNNRLVQKIWTRPIVENSDDKLEISNGLEIIKLNDKIVIRHPAKLYEITIDLQRRNQLPTVKITRAYPHSRYETTGLCHADKLHNLPEWSPVSLLKTVLEQSTETTVSNEIFTETELMNIRRCLSQLDEEVIPYNSSSSLNQYDF